MSASFTAHKSLWACVYVHNKWTRVNSVSAVFVLPDTPEILRCRLDLFTSAALSNQDCLQTTWLQSNGSSEKPLVTTSVSLGFLRLDLNTDTKAVQFQIIEKV